MILFQQNCYFCTTVYPIHRINTGFWRETIESFSPPNSFDSEDGCSSVVTCHLGVQTDFNHRKRNLNENYLAESTMKFEVEFIIPIQNKEKKFFFFNPNKKRCFSTMFFLPNAPSPPKC